MNIMPNEKLRDLSCKFCEYRGQMYRGKKVKAKFFARVYGVVNGAVEKSWLEPMCNKCGRNYPHLSFREAKNEWITQQIMGS